MTKHPHKPPKSDDEEPPKLHGRLQLVYLALKVIEVAMTLLGACL